MTLCFDLLPVWANRAFYE